MKKIWILVLLVGAVRENYCMSRQAFFAYQQNKAWTRKAQQESLIYLPNGEDLPNTQKVEQKHSCYLTIGAVALSMASFWMLMRYQERLSSAI